MSPIPPDVIVRLIGIEVHICGCNLRDVRTIAQDLVGITGWWRLDDGCQYELRASALPKTRPADGVPLSLISTVGELPAGSAAVDTLPNVMVPLGPCVPPLETCAVACFTGEPTQFVNA